MKKKNRKRELQKDKSREIKIERERGIESA